MIKLVIFYFHNEHKRRTLKGEKGEEIPNKNGEETKQEEEIKFEQGKVEFVGFRLFKFIEI